MKNFQHRVDRLEGLAGAHSERLVVQDPVILLTLYEIVERIGPRAIASLERDHGKFTEARLEEMRRMRADRERTSPPKIDLEEVSDPTLRRLLSRLEDSRDTR